MQESREGGMPGASWEVPEYTTQVHAPRRTKFCLVIPVYNEGERIHSVLKKTDVYAESLDILILDKGSTDGSLSPEPLRERKIRGVLTLAPNTGRLSSQLRMGYAYALQEGYEGIITIDGNDKDDVPALPRFIELLDAGYDFVQASRYVPGGKGINTPRVRDLAIRLIHAPLISLLSGFHYTDTTQGYRGYSRKLLLDEGIAPFRHIFSGYELLAYLSVEAPRRGYRVIETPVTRTYPAGKKVPTKITAIRGNLELFTVLLNLIRNHYGKRP